MNDIKDIISAMKNTDWSNPKVNLYIINCAIGALMRAHEDGRYRARATKAEQENALLRAKLAKKPEGYGLHKTLVEMLKLDKTAQPNQIIQKVKVLRDNQELYKQGAGARQLTMEKMVSLIEIGRKEGITQALETLTKLRDHK